MPKYFVTIPIAGHVTYEIDADNDEEAIDKGMELDPDSEEAIVSYETVRSVNTGNICHFPAPWSATADEI